MNTLRKISSSSIILCFIYIVISIFLHNFWSKLIPENYFKYKGDDIFFGIELAFVFGFINTLLFFILNSSFTGFSFIKNFLLAIFSQAIVFIASIITTVFFASLISGNDNDIIGFYLLEFGIICILINLFVYSKIKKLK